MNIRKGLVVGFLFGLIAMSLFLGTVGIMPLQQQVEECQNWIDEDCELFIQIANKEIELYYAEKIVHGSCAKTFSRTEPIKCVKWECGVRTIVAHPKLVCANELTFYEYGEKLRDPCDVRIPAFTLHSIGGTSFTSPTFTGIGLEKVEVDVNSCIFDLIETADRNISIEPLCTCFSNESCASEGK